MSVPRFRTAAFYNGLGSFKAAFPELYDALIEWEELRGPEDKPRNRNRRKMGFRRGNFNRGLILCSNDKCWEGGYQVDRLIEEMLQEDQNERKGILYCCGRELEEEARRATRCRHRIHYRVTLSKRNQRRAA
ncbi:MAG TPA: hypothetical protein VFB34_10975 [Chloroflexota bacterium]|nr:hypothetical protein [Chloroflexota bacterium]